MNDIVILDLSFWQRPTETDYDLVAANVDGVILRAAYGAWKDTEFENHYRELTKREVPLGAYHYIIGNYTGSMQAEIMKRAVEGKALPLNLWTDVEDRRPITALTPRTVDDYIRELDKLKRSGIYTGKYAWDEIMGTAAYADRELWIANYYVKIPNLPKTGGWKTYLYHQYTDNGKVPGLRGDIDLNAYNGTRQDFERMLNLDQEPITWEQEIDAWARKLGYNGQKPNV